MGKIILLGLVGAILSVVLKKERPEMALMLSVITGVLILGFVLTPLGELMKLFRETAEKAGIGSGYFAAVWKVLGIAYLTQFGAQLCADAGESAVAAKLELAGKILMMAVSAPVLTGLLDSVLGLF